jgi:Ser/Thr protein kinase RdoA (MazF antagonist)|tara:strand:+ start:1061 stop:2065 length:1005 start_codon:yes stop_codon:yes gene_type:complete
VSVFSTPPPNFSTEEAEAMVFNFYGLLVTASVLDSERDQNFLCSTPDGQKMVLKISNPDEDGGVLEMQNRCMKHIRDHGVQLQVPLVVAGIERNEIMAVDQGATTCLVRLVHYLPGPLLKDVLHQESMLSELGSSLGHLCLAMSGFEHPNADRDFPWDIARMDFIKTHKHYVSEDAGIVDHFLRLYEKNVLPITARLRKAVIHNDCNDHNVLVHNDGSIRGIIDFGDMVCSFVACEPAVCMAYVALETDKPLRAIGQVLTGFHGVFPLTAVELRSVIYLVCIRLCITVTMAAYRKNLFSENEYISVTEVQAWNFLKKMQNEDLQEWSRTLSESC